MEVIRIWSPDSESIRTPDPDHILLGGRMWSLTALVLFNSPGLFAAVAQWLATVVNSQPELLRLAEDRLRVAYYSLSFMESPMPVTTHHMEQKTVLKANLDWFSAV